MASMNEPEKAKEKKKPHGMTGQVNASKGREHWVQTSMRVDPVLFARMAADGQRIGEFVNEALKDKYGE